jgi:hypothetical protein
LKIEKGGEVYTSKKKKKKKINKTTKKRKKRSDDEKRLNKYNTTNKQFWLLKLWRLLFSSFERFNF